MSKQITIQKVLVQVDEPYSEGHTCTEAEAKALNQVRSENIRNNMAKKVKEAIEAAGSPEAAQKEVQKLVSAYEKEYVFSSGSVGRARLDPLEKEARAIAKAYINGELKKQGMTQKSYIEKIGGQDKFDEKVADLAAHEKIIETAKKSLAARQKTSSELADFTL